MTLRTFLITAVSIVFGLLMVMLAVDIYGRQNYHRYPRPREATTACKALLEAQELYHRTDYDKDGTLEYATNIQELRETQPGLEDICLVDRVLAEADATRTDRTPRSGYFFKILIPSKERVEREQAKFLSGGNDIHYHAILAYPALTKDEDSYYPSYLINSNGITYEKCLGTEPLKAGDSIHEFNPDSTWKVYDW